MAEITGDPDDADTDSSGWCHSNKNGNGGPNKCLIGIIIFKVRTYNS